MRYYNLVFNFTASANSTFLQRAGKLHMQSRMLQMNFTLEILWQSLRCMADSICRGTFPVKIKSTSDMEVLFCNVSKFVIAVG